MEVPPEVLELCISAGLEQHDLFAVSLTSRMLYNIALPLLYEDPEPTKYSSALHLYRVLELRPHLAALVTFFHVRHIELFEEQSTPQSDEVVEPALPNCRKLHLTGVADSNDLFCPTMNFMDCLRWASNCATLQQLRIFRLGSVTRGGDSCVPPSLPLALDTLWLQTPLSPRYDFPYFNQHQLLWQMCAGWVKHLYVEPNPDDEDIMAWSGPTLANLRSWHMLSVGSSSAAHDEWCSQLHLIEELHGPIRMLTPVRTYPYLRIFKARLYSVMAHFYPKLFRALAEGIENRYCPSLEILELEVVDDDYVTPVAARKRRVEQLVDDTGLGSTCSRKNISVEIVTVP